MRAPPRAKKPVPKTAGKNAKAVSWSDAVGSFENALGHAERSPHTIHHYRDDLKAFAAWWAKMSPTETLTPGAITDYDLSEWQLHLRREKLKDGRTRKPAAINSKVAALNSFLRWADRTGVISALPAAPQRRKLAKRLIKALEPEQQHQLIRCAARDRNKRNRPIVVILLETGVRVAELAAWEWRDIKLRERSSTWEVKQGKGCKPRGPFPMSPKCQKAFQTLRKLDKTAGPDDRIVRSQREYDGGRKKPLTVRGVQELLSRYATDLGWADGLHPHQLRHSFVYNKRRKTPPVEWRTIADFLGHNSVTTTQDSYGTPGKPDYSAAMDADQADHQGDDFDDEDDD
jgi:integrase/recombinase XerC